MWIVRSDFEDCELRWRRDHLADASDLRFADPVSARTWLRRFKTDLRSMDVLRRILHASDRGGALFRLEDGEVIEQIAGLLVSGRLCAEPRIQARGDGGGIKPEPVPEPPPPGPKKPKRKDEKKPSDEAEIVSVEFLDGSKTKELGAKGKHIVNMPRDKKWVDGKLVANIDRLSQKTRVKVRFDKPGSHAFKVKFLPDAKNIAYSAAEKGRNGNFKFQDKEKSYTTDKDGTKIIPTDFFVTAAGAHKYQLQAQDDKKKIVKSNIIEISRLVYYVEIKMTGLATIAPDLKTAEAEYAKHNITLESLDSVEMDHMPNVGKIAPHDEDTFEKKARKAYKLSKGPDKEPYVLAIAYTDQLAVKNPDRDIVKSAVTVGPGKPNAILIPKGPGLTSPTVKERNLWKNVVPGAGWFVSARYLPSGGTAGTDDIEIPEADCTAVPVSAARPDRCKKISVKVSGLPAGTGTVTLRVHWVDRMRGGLAFGGGNLIALCTRAWWRDISAGDQNQTAVHEIGHKVGMVAEGTGTGPDKTASQYTGKGHVGSHCHKGLAAGLASYGGMAGSTCVMFGMTNGIIAFCSDCKPAVRKQDISTGWTGF